MLNLLQSWRLQGRRCVTTLCVASGLLAVAHAQSNQPLPVVASTSIVADWVQQVGGPHVRVQSLVGRMQDPHGFAPTPSHAQAMQDARLVFMIGLGLEGWLSRLSSQSNKAKGEQVFLGNLALGKPIQRRVTSAHKHPHDHDHAHEHHDDHDHDHDDHDDDDHDDHDDDDHDDDDGHDHGGADPHVWQDVRLAVTMVGQIAQRLCAVDASNCTDYRARAKQYTQSMQRLDQAIHTAWAAVPRAARNVVVPHRAFDYYGKAYGLTFYSPVGISSTDNAAAGRMAQLLRTIKKRRIKAIFSEQGANSKLMQNIAAQSGLELSDALWSDTLSLPQGPATTYLDLMRSNSQAMLKAVGAAALQE